MIAGLIMVRCLIYILILGGIVLACVVLKSAWQKCYQKEKKILDRIRNQNPEDMERASITLNFADNEKNSIVVRALRSALKEGQVGLQPVEFYNSIHLSRYLAGIFVFVGLLGTVFGIVLAISDLGSTVASTAQVGSAVSGSSSTRDTASLTNENWSHILAGINNLLVGMRAVSDCTLLGIIATVVVSLLNTVYIKACQDLESELTLLADTTYLPLYRAEVARRHHADMQQNLNAAAKLLDDGAKELASKLPSAITILDQTTTQAAELTKELYSAATELNEAYQQAEKGRQLIEAHLKRVETMLESNLPSLEHAAEELKAAAGTVSAERSSLAGISATVSNAARQMGEEIHQLRESLVDAQQEHNKHQEQLISRVEATQNRLQDLLRTFDWTLNDMSGVQDLNKLRQEIEQLKKDVLRELHVSSQQIQEAVVRFEDTHPMPSAPSMVETSNASLSSPHLHVPLHDHSSGPATRPATYDDVQENPRSELPANPPASDSRAPDRLLASQMGTHSSDNPGRPRITPAHQDKKPPLWRRLLKKSPH